MKTFINDLLKDDSGKYSLSKVILCMVAISATILLWKMVLLKETTDMIWVGYLAFGTGHASMNKFLDRKKNNEGT